MHPHDSEMLEKVTRIETLLTTFIGENGNNGQFGTLKTQVAAHQTYIDQQTGAGQFLHYLFTAFVAGISGMIAGWFRGK